MPRPPRRPGLHNSAVGFAVALDCTTAQALARLCNSLAFWKVVVSAITNNVSRSHVVTNALAGKACQLYITAMTSVWLAVKIWALGG